ncbi:serine/threonine-protein kinase [Streptomyces sp. NPDC056347]|uniref:serine/threonine-protein kinase n=1 Tax=Streptomyces sp. NPDC056347 TaxID=3345790 RepID=UPI0035E01DCA
MGTVHLARSRGGRLLAVKVARPELASDPVFRARFRAEVDAARRVGGFHTAQVVDSDPDGHPPWLATAYVPGPTLAERLRAEGRMPEDELKRLGAALAEALAAVHGCGLVHRDLKPGNIIMAPDGPRVLDFGISRAVESTRLTATGHSFGTPGYLAPEQAEGREVTGAADVFALGAVLVAAAGGSAFGEGAPMMLMYRSVHTEADVSSVPEGIRGTVEACLAKDPALRPTTEQLLDTFADAADVPYPPTVLAPPPTLVAPPSWPVAPPPGPVTPSPGPGTPPPGPGTPPPAEIADFFYAEDDERTMVIDTHGVEIRLADVRDISIEFLWEEIASIGHRLDYAGRRCTLFIECTDDAPYDCTLTAPDDETYDRWARHLPDVLDHFCD